ncbi:MAG TPA: outer membrane beta-barrel protein [Flavobacteriales bacterium]|jgi:hypothetical protein|nr:outer membrane beta-barrel protein [Flavobacteriales bacterium]
MQRSICSLLLVCALPIAASAQFVQRIGMQQGLAFSRITLVYDPDPTVGIDDESERLTGYSARMFVDLFETTCFHLSPGIGFIQRGGAQTDRLLTVGGSIPRMARASNLNYVSFDLSAKAGHAFGRTTPYAFAGPRIDVLLNASTAFSYFDQFRALNRTRTGLRYGAGLSVDLGSLSAFAEWCALWDLNDVTTDLATQVIDTSDGRWRTVNTRITDRTWMLSVGLAVKLCGRAS